MARLQSTLLIHSKQIISLPLAKRTEGLKLLVTIRRCNVEFDTDAIQTIVHCSLSGIGDCVGLYLQSQVVVVEGRTLVDLATVVEHRLGHLTLHQGILSVYLGGENAFVQVLLRAIHQVVQMTVESPFNVALLVVGGLLV
jgi:hypothetical protein